MGSDNVSGAENQQRSLESRLCWLGGIIDGEGMITAIKRSESRRKQTGFIPRISIANTNLIMINEVVAILSELKLVHYVQTWKDADHEHWKRKHEVLINGILRCSEALPILIPYLVVKRDKAEKLLMLCESRMSLRRKTSYSGEEIELALSLRERI